MPLFAAVGSFTQPSWITADFITSVILQWSKGFKKITEYGAGIGQYTVPLLRNKSYVTVYENNPLALQALQLNVTKFSDFFCLNPHETPAADLFLVNPPRSGLKEFGQHILKSNVGRVIYVSCSIDSLAIDLIQLSTQYKIKDFKLVDQFPHSDHFETCVLLEKI